MQFVYPYFLFALVAMAIPILIHLFNFRKYKKIYFSNVQFLKQVQQETKSVQRLKHYLILATRILAILFLVLAFAQPMLSKQKNVASSDKNYTQVYLDNSFSMENVASNGQLIELAKNYAQEIAQSLKESDQIQLLTNDLESKHQQLLTPDECSQFIQEIQTSPSFKTIADILQRFYDVQKSKQIAQSHIYLISDFQKIATESEKWNIDSNNVYTLIPIYPQTNKNIVVDSIWCESPELQVQKNIQLFVKIRNNSEEEISNVPLKLFFHDQLKNTQSVSFAAQEEKIIPIDFILDKVGWHSGYVEIEDQDITFDDRFYVSLFIPESISILEIKGKNGSTYFQQLFSKDDYFSFESFSENQINYGSFASNQLIILNALDQISSGLSLELQKFLAKGGNAIFIPSENMQLESINQFLTLAKVNRYENKDTSTVKMENIKNNTPFYKDIFERVSDEMDVPFVKNYYIVSNFSKSNNETILKLRNGKKLYTKETSGNGHIYLLSTPLSEKSGNFARHTFFVVTMIKTALMSYPIPELATFINNNTQAKINWIAGSKDVLKIQNENKSIEIIPHVSSIQNQTYLNTGLQITQAGNYRVLANDEVVGNISLNYDRKESQLMMYNTAELEEIIQKNGWKNVSILTPNIKTFAKDIQQQQNGIPLWKYCILLTLFFLLLETLFIRFLK